MRRSSRLKSGKVVSKYIENKDDRSHNDTGADVSSDNVENTSKSILEEHPSEIPSENESSEEESYNQDEELFDERKEIENMDKPTALEYIRKNYSNPESIICYASISGLRDIFKILSVEEITNVLSTFESWSLMKSSRDPKRYNPFIAQHLRDVMQIDCITMREIADQNLGVKHLFCAIDVFSKFLWVVPLYSTKAEETTQAIKAIFSDLEYLPETVVCDSGPEFRNNLFISMMKRLRVKLIFSQSQFKASHVERVQYTLERLIYSHITAFETLNYLDVLQLLVKRYNETSHSFTGFSPTEVEKDEQVQDKVALKFAKRYQKLKRTEPKYKVGDWVRILLFKSPFHRGYNIQRSYERYRIHKILPHKQPLYVLIDSKNRVLVGLFGEYELTKVNLSRFRAIVKERKKKKGEDWVRLHYKGYDEEFDEWRRSEDLVDIENEQEL